MLGMELETHPIRGHGKAACVQRCTTLQICFMVTGHSHQLTVIYEQDSSSLTDNTCSYPCCPIDIVLASPWQK